MGSKFFFGLNSIKSEESTGGSFSRVTSDEVSSLINISFSHLKLKKKGAQEPIWHPNSHKIGFCLQGNCLVSIRSPTGVETFTIQKGDVFFVPKGFIHNIINYGESEASICFACSDAKPDVMRLSQAIHSLSEEVFVSTFNSTSEFLKGLKKAQKDDIVTLLPNFKAPSHSISSRFKFNIGDSSKPVLTKGGYLQLATKQNLPVLEGLGILGFGLNEKGAVEPHWHTNAGELVYIVKGQTRITVLAPDGKVDVFEVKGGEGVFAPASFFHNIQNIGKEEVEVIAFFSHAEPDYIGIGEVVGSYPNEVLAAVFDVKPDYFESFKKTAEPLVIVPV